MTEEINIFSFNLSRIVEPLISKTQTMFIKQLYTNCLAQAAYYLESEGEALIVDPMREPQPYIDLATHRKSNIKYVFETHFHADFVSGHLDIAAKTGAQIIFGPNAKPAYDAHIAKDGERFKLGNITCELIHTPGHTIESSCLLVYNEKGFPEALFTGDTLFVGDVGRPDLMSGNLSNEELAAMMFDSLQKIKKLPDEVTVYPGHGAGSSCGKNIGRETVTTIGEQKKYNYAIKEKDKDAFIFAVTSDLPVPPQYFFKDAQINISGYDCLEILVNKSKKYLTCDEFLQEMKSGAIVLDTRDASDFAKNHFEGSLNVGLNGDFANWVGTLIEFGKPILLISDREREDEAIVRLARIGYSSVVGILKDDLNSCKNKTGFTSMETINPDDIQKMMDAGDYVLLDVRRKSEREQVRVKNSVCIPLNDLMNRMTVLDKSEKYLVICAGGYRSMIASSFMKSNGFRNVINVNGGVNLLQKVKPALIVHIIM